MDVLTLGARFESLHASLREQVRRTRDLEWRERSLARLEKEIRARESEINQALMLDLGKPELESYLTEIGIVLGELKAARREFRTWASVRKVSSPFNLFPARSEVHIAPKGAVLILSPWNYPFHLALAPLIAAVAAGNTVALKLSEFAPNVATVVEKIVRNVWPEGEVVAVTGDASVAAVLLDRPWDHVFFTGGTEIGRKVMLTCAKYLTPVTLELGGKSPCIIDRDVDMDVASRRVMWGKTVNAGQTCIAPDYLLVHSEVRAEFVEALKRQSRIFFGESPTDSLRSDSYASIVSDRHFARLESLLAGCTILDGGVRDAKTRKFAPTLVEVSDSSHPLLTEEIFGPILPILSWSTRQDLDRILVRNPNPLAFYVFSRNATFANDLMRDHQFGGGCVNDTLVQIANGRLPFGGIGESGMGAYHGEDGFEVFSHRKSVVLRSFYFDVMLRYPPYKESWKKFKGLM